jgi:TetR/AcrR family transcriptional regulator, lmrAB and yxaGH operons repressor
MRAVKVESEQVGEGLVAAFRRDGFAGASLRDLKAATGLHTASLYHRFANGKADMALAALDHLSTCFTATVLAPLETDSLPAARLRLSADGVAAFFDDGRLACLLAIMALSDAPPMVHDRVRATFRTWRAALASALDAAGVANAHEVAEDRIAAIEGALILARASGDTGCFARALARLAVV